MKRLLTLSSFLLLSIMTFAQTEVNGIYYEFSGTEATVVSGTNKYTGSVTIPASVNYGGDAYSVTSIGSSAFYDCLGLTSVTIHSSVTSIGRGAFYGCSGLTSVTIPNSVTSIESSAFHGCSGLTSITIPSSVTSIDSGAFAGCTSLTNIQVDAGNSKYDSRNNCNAIIRTSSNTLIAGCKTTTIPSSVTSIGKSAFYRCSGLTSITIPNSVTSIGVGAFKYCTGLTSITIPFGVTSIDDEVFEGCYGLISIIIHPNITNIGKESFKGCTGLTSITIPNSVTSIKNGAFSGCSGLTSITIPNSVTSIGTSPFGGCDELTSIKVQEGNTKYDSRNNCNAIIETATNTLVTGCKNSVIPNSVTSIGERAFRSCSGLTSIDIPNSVTSIGQSAFAGCSGLTSITIPNSVSSIGSSAFENCSKLTSITIPNSVTSIGNYAFLNCSGLTAIYSYIENPTSSTGANFDSSNYSNATLYVPFGTKDKYLATDGWKNFTNIVEMSIEPIEDNTVIEFDDKDYIVDNTPVDLNNTVINDMYISMDNKSDVNNPDGFYDSTEKCIVINKATSSDAIATAVASDLGSSDFINNYTGIVIEVNGKGSVKINAQTAGNNKLAVKIGSADAKTYTQATKGDVAINYDVTENTYVYIYAVDANNQQQSLSMDITETSDNAVKVYSVTVTPDATAIETVTETDIPAAVFGKVYSIDGKQLTAPQKGLNILKMSDGTTRKVVK